MFDMFISFGVIKSQAKLKTLSGLDEAALLSKIINRSTCLVDYPKE